HIATTGRPGPVLIDVCKDAQQAEGEWEYTSCSALPGYRPAFEPDAESAKKAIELLAQAKRPVILAGHGVILSHAEEELLEVAERSGTPVGTTLLGVGAFPTRHPLALHMTGFMGTGWNIKAVQNADVLMMVGMRVDDRVTAVGQNQIWAARGGSYPGPGLFLHSGGSGARGFARPAASAARRGRPDRDVGCVAGGGGFVMAAQELSVAVEHQVGVKIVLLN